MSDDKAKINMNDAEHNKSSQETKTGEDIVSPDKENELDKLKKERDEYKDQALRLAAELDNFKKRNIREKQELVEYANEKLLQKLLPLLDDMENAIEAGNKSKDFEGLLKGIEMIYQKAIKTFEEAGVKCMENPVGKQFDVQLQESLLHTPSNKPEGEILQLIQKGYIYNDKVLRYAKVITSAGNVEEQTKNNN